MVESEFVRSAADAFYRLLMADAAIPVLDTIARALSLDVGCEAIVIDGEGRVLAGNFRAVKLHPLLLEPSREPRLHDLFPSDYAAEQMSHIGRAIGSKSCVSVLGMRRGAWTVTSFRPLSFSPVRALSVSASATPESEAVQGPLTRAAIDDLGHLGSLSERELEVLRCLGRGMTANEIAAQIHRSVKTVEWHRVSLGAKMRAANRVELAALAHRAGLSDMSDEDFRTVLNRHHHRVQRLGAETPPDDPVFVSEG